MFRIIQTHLENYKSYHEATFVVRDGIHLVQGVNKDSEEMGSNGSGKTTVLLDAPFWCITGDSLEKTDSVDDVINLTTKKNCLVTCEIEVDAGRVEITRTRKHEKLGDSLRLVFEGQDITCQTMKLTQEKIYQLIPVSPNVLKSTILMPQDLRYKFSLLAGKERVELFEKLRENPLWENIREASNGDIKKLTEQLSELQGQILFKNGGLTALAKSIDEKALAAASIETDINGMNVDLWREKEREATQKVVAYQAADVRTSSALNVCREQYKAVVDTAMQELDVEYNHQSTTLSTQQSNLIASLNRLQDELRVETEEINSKISHIDTRIREQNEIKAGFVDKRHQSKLRLNQLSSKWESNTVAIGSTQKLVETLSTNQCPACHQPVDQAHVDEERAKFTAEIEGLVKENETLQISMLAEREQLSSLAEAITISDDVVVVLQKERALLVESRDKVTDPRIDGVRKEIDDTTDKLAQLAVDLQVKKNQIRLQAAELGAEISDHEHKCRENGLRLQVAKKELTDIEAHIVGFEATKRTKGEQLNKLVVELETLRSEEVALKASIVTTQTEVTRVEHDLSVARFYYDQLGPKGRLRPYLVARDIRQVNKSLRYYSNKLFGNCEIQLTEPTISDSDIEVLITTSSGLRKTVKQLSAGERKRLDLAIQFALFDLMRTINTIDPKMLVLDEVFDGLDAVGVYKAMDLIAERTEYIPAIYVISHNQTLQSMILSRIVVEKCNDTSTLVEVACGA